MPIDLVLWCDAVLLGTAVLAVGPGRRPWATWAAYGTSLAASSVALLAASTHLIGDGATVATLTLPLGLPWLGMHLRIDALAAFFLIVVNLGGAAASLYGLGHGRHEPAPHRVLPFFPAFLAGMNLEIGRAHV